MGFFCPATVAVAELELSVGVVVESAAEWSCWSSAASGDSLPLAGDVLVVVLVVVVSGSFVSPLAGAAAAGTVSTVVSAILCTAIRDGQTVQCAGWTDDVTRRVRVSLCAINQPVVGWGDHN